MTNTNFLTYKGRPLVRCGNDIFYGDMNDAYVIKLSIISSVKDGNNDVANKISVKLIKNNTENIENKAPEKDSTRDTLYDALDLSVIWLERALKEHKE